MLAQGIDKKNQKLYSLVLTQRDHVAFAKKGEEKERIMDRSRRVDFTSDEQEGASALLAIPAILLIVGLVVLLPGAQDMKEAHKPELASLFLKVAVSFIVLGIAGIIALWKMR